MAMLTCKECGKKISCTAEICPHCGHKTRFGKEAEDSRRKTKVYIGLVFLFACTILILLLCFTGCEAEEKAGVINKESYCYYVISLPADKIEEYFTPIGETGMSSFTDVKTTSTVVVKHVAIAEGGWIAYVGGRVAYVPPEAGESGMKNACIYIAMNSNNYMTIEEAKAYISWLKP